MNLTITSNGDLAFKSTLSPLLDLYAGLCRPITLQTLKEKLETLMPQVWAQGPEHQLLLIKLAFYKRDTLKGAGEKDIFYQMIKWFLTHHSEFVYPRLSKIPEFGYFKDLLELMIQNPGHQTYLRNILKEALKKAYDEFTSKLGQTTLVAKWVPSRGTYYDIKIPGLIKFLSSIFNDNRKEWQKNYRTNIHNMRLSLNIPEIKMSRGEWSEIDYSKVPSRAMKLYKPAFIKHDPDGFAAFKTQVEEGKKTIKSKQLMPHELLRNLENDDDLQWNALLAKFPNLGDTMVFSDVSGSMIGLPMDVSISLGLLISSMPGNYRNQFITFSEFPSWNVFKDNQSWSSKIKQIRNTQAPCNTDLRKAFDVLLTNCLSKKVPAPKRIIIISDMQFDQIHCNSGGWNQSTFQSVKIKFENHDMKMPEIIFGMFKDQLIVFQPKQMILVYAW